MIRINLFNVRDEARRFAHEVIVPMIDESDDPPGFVGELIELAIRGEVPEWFANEVELALEAELIRFEDDIDILDYFRAVVVELPTWLL